MTNHTAQTAAAAIVGAFRGEAAAAAAYVGAYAEAFAAVKDGAKESEIAKATAAAGIKAKADLVGDFVLTAPLVLGDNGITASRWIAEKYGEDTVKRVHTIVTAARVAKGQGKPVVRRLTVDLLDMLADPDNFDADLYAAAVIRALTALAKVKPAKDAPEAAEDGETEETETEEQTTGRAPVVDAAQGLYETVKAFTTRDDLAELPAQAIDALAYELGQAIRALTAARKEGMAA